MGRSQHRSIHRRESPRRHLGVVLLLLTYFCVLAFWMLSAPAGRWFDVVSVEAAAKLLLWGGICLGATMVMRRATFMSALSVLGLTRSAWKGVLLSVAATTPMAIAALTSLGRADADLIAGNAVVGPLAEELLFRGFLFGSLVSVAGWRVSAAIATSAFVFGLAHIRDADMALATFTHGGHVLDYGVATSGNDVLWIGSGSDVWWQFLSTRVPELLIVAVPLACGGAVLAWITWRWGSLWPAVALHGCMNLWWDVARSGRTGLFPVAQVLAMVLVVVLTGWATRRPAPPPGAPGNAHA
jgi:membrane protease YdiL (CAAX protease family)